MKRKARITEALKILQALGMPKAQHNDRTALCLLALVDVTKKKDWHEAASPLK